MVDPAAGRSNVVRDTGPGEAGSGLGSPRPLLLYGGVWLAAVAAGWGTGTVSPAEPAGVFLVFGLTFSALAWLSTGKGRRATAPPSVTGAQLLAVGVLLLGVTVYLTWGRGMLVAPLMGEETGPARGALLDLLEKLLVFVLLPVAVFRLAFGYAAADFGLPRFGMLFREGRWKPVLLVGGAFVTFQAMFGRAAQPVMEGEFGPVALALGLPLVLAWLVLEVGLVEELLFRTLVQDRLTARFRSGWAGVTGASLLFGLAHAPGLYLRGGGATTLLGPDPGWVAALVYSVGVISVAGIFLGILWERTRSLPVVALVHALGDLLPNTAKLLRAFGVQ